MNDWFIPFPTGAQFSFDSKFEIPTEYFTTEARQRHFVREKTHWLDQADGLGPGVLVEMSSKFHPTGELSGIAYARNPGGPRRQLDQAVEQLVWIRNNYEFGMGPWILSYSYRTNPDELGCGGGLIIIGLEDEPIEHVLSDLAKHYITHGTRMKDLP